MKRLAEDLPRRRFGAGVLPRTSLWHQYLAGLLMVVQRLTGSTLTAAMR
jgi:hypothetical protein